MNSINIHNPAFLRQRMLRRWGLVVWGLEEGGRK
jgi:hypothetical protein